MPSEKTVTFVIDLVGDVTERTFKGKFTTKTRLTHREQLRADEFRRSLLGKDPVNASERAQDQATIFAQLNAHLVDAPDFWKTSDGGLELEDENVVVEVYNEVAKAILEYRKSLAKSTGEIKTDLQAKLESGATAA